MDKIKDVIQRVQSLYSKGVESDDTRLTNRHIYHKMTTTRAKLLTQKVNKKQKISQWDLQTLNCVELVKVKPYECPCLPDVGCEILRTKYELPIPITSLTKHFIESVTSLEGSINFAETTWTAKKYKKGNKYTANKPDYYIRENYLYITTSKKLRAISITGLFEDTLEASNYQTICEDDEEDCISFLDMSFPLSKDLIDTLVELIAKELIIAFNQSREDITNNTNSALETESK